MKREINYTFWGESIDANWYDWYLAVKDLFERTGFKITHYGADFDSYHPDKCVTALRKEKAIVELLKSGEVPDCLECYAVPNDFKTVLGDFTLYCVREKTHISVVVREDYVPLVDENAILGMKKFINFESGEVFSANKCNSCWFSSTRDRDKNMVKMHGYELIRTIEA